MECKYCNAELEEGSSVCPACGKDNEPQKPWGKIIVGIVAAIALIAVFAVVVMGGADNKQPVADDSTPVITTPATTTGAAVTATVPKDGNPDDITCKGTYTVADDVAAQENKTVIATMGDSQLTNGLLQIYYWNLFYNSYSTYVNNYGMDVSQPLDVQLSPDETTWQQAMLEIAIDNWRVDAALAKLAAENNVTLDAEAQAELDGVAADLEAKAKEGGFENATAMLKKSLGAGCTLEDYLAYAHLYYYAAAYYNQASAELTVSEKEMEDFYKDYESLFTEQGVDKTTRWVSVRHILIQPKDCTFNNNFVVADDAQWEACRQEAQGILDKWLAEDGTEEGFGELAKELTADGNGDQGGLYEKVSEGQMVATFNDWCFDESRQPGDSGLVKTEYGYHIMYFVGDEFVWEYYAEQNVLSIKKNELYTNAADAEKTNIEYSKIVLANVDYMSE